MGSADTEMQLWCDQALVIIRSLLDAVAPAHDGTDEDAEGNTAEPPVDEDELRDAVHHAERWKAMHPCPDSQLGEGLAHLLTTWSAVVTGDDHDGGSQDAGRPVQADPDQRQQQIKAVTGDTVRFQAQLDAELLPGQ